MIHDVLHFVREQLVQVPDDHEGYGQGYTIALREVEEYILDLMWEAGDDDDD